MATPSTGVGRGTGGGGKKPGGGRPKGALNRRATALIAEAEREGLMMPVDYLLSIMRDPHAEQRDRMTAATAAAPYCHARLTALQVMPDPRNLDDAMLMFQVTRLEQQAAMLPEREVSETVKDQVERLLEDIPRLSFKRQEALLRLLATASEAGLQRLHDPNRPGAVPPRFAPVHPREPEAALTTQPSRSALQRAPEATPAPLDGRRLRYNPSTGKLEPVP